MKLFLRHTFYRTITISRILSILGSYIYNLVFIVYASSLPYKTTALFLANIILVIPTLLSFWLGVRADRTVEKSKWVISLGFIQALLFTLVAYLIGNPSFLVFSTICFINVVSDMMSDFGSGLRMPIMQHNLDESDLYEAYSFTQVVTHLSTIVGQALGVWLLTISANNFALVALINALSFLLSSLLLWKNKDQLTHAEVVLGEKTSLWETFKTLYDEMTVIFREVADSSFTQLLFSILFINALGGSLGALYNFSLLDADFMGLSYAQLLFLVQVLFVAGSILGSLTPNDYFGQKSITELLIITALAFIALGLSNALNLNFLVGAGLLSFAAYIVGKAMPKLDALLMANLPAEKLAQSNSFLSLVFAFSVPIGTILFSSLALYNLFLCWLIFAGLGGIALILASGKLFNN